MVSTEHFMGKWHLVLFWPKKATKITRIEQQWKKKQQIKNRMYEAKIQNDIVAVNGFGRINQFTPKLKRWNCDSRQENHLITSGNEHRKKKTKRKWTVTYTRDGNLFSILWFVFLLQQYSTLRMKWKLNTELWWSLSVSIWRLSRLVSLFSQLTMLASSAPTSLLCWYWWYGER